MNKPKLMVMCGLSASGKSTIAKEFAKKENYEIVSSDAIRAEICPGGVSDQSMNDQVFKLYHQRICGWLMIGRNVIADATNITMKSRHAIFEAVKDIECEKIAYVMTKNFENCIDDDNARGEKRVSHKVINKQIYKFQIPFYEEGFDEIVIHKTTKYADITCGDSEDKIKSRVGSITADEVALAGAYGDVYLNETYYLFENAQYKYYWTLSRADFGDYDDNAFFVYGGGSLSRDCVSDVNPAVRPSVTLVTNTQITKGVGTKGEPYIIEVE